MADLLDLLYVPGFGRLRIRETNEIGPNMKSVWILVLLRSLVREDLACHGSIDRTRTLATSSPYHELATETSPPPP